MDSSHGSSGCCLFARVRTTAILTARLLGSAVRRPGTDSNWERVDLTGSWDAHPVPLPCSATPAGPLRHTCSRRFGAAPAPNTTKAPTIETISGLNHTASAPAVYASRRTSPTAMQDSLAAGGEPLPRGSRTLWASNRFQHKIISYESPFPGFACRSLGSFLVSLIALLSGSSDVQAGFQFNDFSSVNDLIFVQDAAEYSTRLRLTPADEYKTGAVWYAAKQDVSSAFETTFQFELTGHGQNMPADGFAFVIQNSNASAVGFGGGWMGFADITNSIAVEFDTFQNPWEYYVPLPIVYTEIRDFLGGSVTVFDAVAS